MGKKRALFLEEEFKQYAKGHKFLDFKIIFEKVKGRDRRLFVLDLPTEKLNLTVDMLLRREFKIYSIYNNLNYRIDKKDNLEELNTFLFNINKLSDNNRKIFETLPKCINKELTVKDIINLMENSTLYNDIKSLKDLGLFYKETMGLTDPECTLTDEEYGGIALDSGMYFLTNKGVLEVFS